MGKVIRVLYGNISGNEKLTKEIIGSFEKEWARGNIAYYVLGDKNAVFLESLGAKDVKLIDSKDDMRPANRPMTHFFNKSYLLERAMRDYDEILFADYDATMQKDPDEKMWKLLREKKGAWHGAFQCPNISYKNIVCLTKLKGGIRDPQIHPLRKCLNTCVLYCRDKTWVDGHLDAFYTCPLFGGQPIFGGGEAVLMYYLDREYGIMDIDQMIDNFEPKIILLDRGVGGKRWKKYTDLEKKQDEIYFKHF